MAMLIATIRQALDTMRVHRRWALLTMFGIIWGTASVVLLVGWGVGVQGMVERGMQKIGKNLVYVFPGRVGEDLSPADDRRVLTFDLDDAAAVRAVGAARGHGERRDQSVDVRATRCDRTHRRCARYRGGHAAAARRASGGRPLHHA